MGWKVKKNNTISQLVIPPWAQPAVFGVLRGDEVDGLQLSYLTESEEQKENKTALLRDTCIFCKIKKKKTEPHY